MQNSSTTTPKPTGGDSDSPAARLQSLRSRWQSLSTKATLNDAASALAKTTSQILGLADEIAGLRGRGYAFHWEWEVRAAALKNEWPAAQQQAIRLLNTRARGLANLSNQAELTVRQAAGSPSKLTTLDGQLDGLERQIEAAKKEIAAQVAPFDAQVGDLAGEMEKVDFMLGVVESGVVKLFPDECGVAAFPANMVLDKKEKDEGVLLLTDKRLIFIHEEEKVLKKVLFIVTEKKTVRTLRWAAPIGAVDTLAAEDKGGFLGMGAKELLTINFDDKAKDVPKQVIMHLTQGTENETWRALIMQVKSGDIEAQRATSPTKSEGASATAAPARASLPTVCPSCGAKLPPVYKGMTRMECEFCHAAIPIG